MVPDISSKLLLIFHRLLDTPIKQETIHHPPTKQTPTDKNKCGKVFHLSLIQLFTMAEALLHENKMTDMFCVCHGACCAASQSTPSFTSKMTFPHRMRSVRDGQRMFSGDLCIIHPLTLDNKWLSHIQNTIVCPKTGVRGHNCDRTVIRKQCTEKNTPNPNNTTRPLFHDGVCMPLVVSLLLLLIAGHRCHLM